MKHHFSIRCAAAILAVCQIGLSQAAAAFDNGFSYTYPIGQGTTYTRTEGKNSAGLQKANYITYSQNMTVLPQIAYAGDRLYGSQATIMNAAKYMTNQGKPVIGGTNADFFVMGSGIPIGLVIDGGELVSSDAWQYAVGFSSSGTTVMGRPTMNMQIRGASGTVSVTYFNKTRTTAGIYLLDRNYDSSTHFSANGKSIILERIDDTPVKVNGSVKMKVINKGSGSGALTITDNQMVLTQSDGAAGNWVDFPIGEEVTLSVYSADSSWNYVQYAVGGKLLISGGTVSTDGIDAASSRTARTGIGRKADGTILLYEADGLQSSSSVGLTAGELGNQLLSLGCTDAICLDGGGSSAMVVRKPGEGEASLVTSPSDGAQRACANYIFFVNTAAPTGVASYAVLTPSYRYLMPGASTWFSIKGADASYGPAPAPQGLGYAVSNDLGAVDIANQTFTASTTTGNATITCMSEDGITGAMTVCITGDVNAITVSNGTTEISSLSVKPESKTDLTGTAYHQGQKMASADSSFQWSVTGGIGSVDASGVFTAAPSPASGTLVCSYGATRKAIAVTVGMGDPQGAIEVSDFETTQPGTTDSGLALSVTSDLSEVACNTKSLKVSGSGEGLISFPAYNVSTMKYLSLYTRSTGSSSTVTAVFLDADGNEVTASLPAPTGAWKETSLSVPASAVTFRGLRVSPGSGANAALFLDQIIFTGNHAISNTDAPVLTLNSSAVSVSAGASATVTATATMESGKYPIRSTHVSVKVDGKTVTGLSSMSGTTLSVKTGALAAGTHTVAITVWDDAGHMVRKSATVTAGTASNVFADTTGHWAGGYAALLKANGIMQGETSGGKTYFRPARNLTRMEFAVTMARMLKLDTSDTGALNYADDSAIPSWARGAVSAAAKAGIMSGKAGNNGKTYFDPSASITRAEVMTVIGRTLPIGFAAAPLGYRDASSIPSWASDAIRHCISANVVSGYSDNTLRPNAPITRGEIAKILAFL